MIKYGVVTLLGGAAYVITMVFAASSVTPVRKRMIVSAIRTSRIDMQLLIGCAIVTAALVAVAAQLAGRARKQDA